MTYVIAHAKQSVVECLSSRETSEKLNVLISLKTHSHILTESKRMRHFEQKWKIVEPVEHVFLCVF